jgi:hypothetical protein
MSNTTPRLTVARQAFWKAFDNTPTLNAQFNRTYRFDATEQTGDIRQADIAEYPPRPTIAQMPALACLLASDATPWVTNQQQNLSSTCLALLWVPQYDVGKAESLWEQLVLALWQAIDPVTTVECWRGDPNNGRAIWNFEVLGTNWEVLKIEAANVESPVAIMARIMLRWSMIWDPKVQTG